MAAATTTAEVSQPPVPAAEESSRADLYSLLGSVLCKAPDASLLERLADIEDGDPDTQLLAGAWSGLKMAASNRDEKNIAEEYHSLFIGIGRGEIVPYGSWYLTGFLMEKPLALLRRDLAALGFERQEGVHEPEDHAGALCETMSLIINSSAEIAFDRQRAFFGEHMAPWIGKFFDDLRNADSADFYAAIGELGNRFMDFESKHFAMLV